MFLVGSNIKLVEAFEVMADIQTPRDRVGFSYFFRCLSVTSFLLWGGAPCHEHTPNFPSGTSQLSQLSEMRAARLQVVQGDKLVLGQNHTGRELLG